MHATTPNEVRECVRARFKGLDNDDLVNSDVGGEIPIDEVLRILRFADNITELIAMVETSGARAQATC